MSRHTVIVVTALFLAAWSFSAAALEPDAPAPAKAVGEKAGAESWPDRRPIGVIFLSEGGGDGSPGFRTPKNPRGWNPNFLKDRAGKPLDVADPHYAEKFDAAVNAFVLQSFDRAERFNCQGVLFWDIEGSEFDHPTTYVGDPLRLPPEMKRQRVRAWVTELERRKMWTGFTFRDTSFVSTPYGANQISNADPADALMAKMQLCRFAYGENCRGAYIDSFCESDSWVDGKVHPRPAALLEKIQSKLPRWLLMPEFAGKDYDKVPRVAPLRYFGAPSVQPFETLVPTDKPLTPEQREQYVRAMRAGALTLVTVTWDSAQTKWVPNAWREAGQDK